MPSTRRSKPVTASCGSIPNRVNTNCLPRSLGAATVTVSVLGDDLDTYFAHAQAHGADIVYRPVDQPYGYREYSARDAEGHLGQMCPGSQTSAHPTLRPGGVSRNLGSTRETKPRAWFDRCGVWAVETAHFPGDNTPERRVGIRLT